LKHVKSFRPELYMRYLQDQGQLQSYLSIILFLMHTLQRRNLLLLRKLFLESWELKSRGNKRIQEERRGCNLVWLYLIIASFGEIFGVIFINFYVAEKR